MLQAGTGWHSFYIRHNQAVEAMVHVHVEAHEAASPYRSPFGSYLVSDAVDKSTLTDFIHYCTQELARKNVSSVRLKHQPEFYAPEKNREIQEALLAAGYTIATVETSAIISVTPEPFESGLHRSEKKRLRKCRDSNLVFESVPPAQLEKIYFFLQDCRKQKGFALSMSFPEIEKLAGVFPDRILLTAVTDGSRVVAANISIRVYDHVLYNFYHDHDSEYDQISPVVLLNEGLYKICQDRRIRLLDLGTSNPDGRLNESLLDFKLRLGARPVPKLTFIKKFT